MPPIIYERPEFIAHRASYCSRAAFLQLIITAIVIVIPIVVVYRSEGFWKKESTYREQPLVKFKDQFIILLHTKNVNDNLLIWSSFDSYNELYQEYLRVGSVSHYSEDWNFDGISDRFLGEFSIPLNPKEEIYGFDIFIVFNYNLKSKSRFRMNTLVHFGHNSALPGSNFYVNGDLHLHLKKPLFHRGVDRTYEGDIFSNYKLFTQGFDLFAFYDNYSRRNVTTVLENKLEIWTPGRTSSQPFTIKAGFWELMKWAWVQYVSVLLIFSYVFTRIKRYIYENQLVPTAVHRPFHDGMVASSAAAKLQLGS